MPLTNRQDNGSAPPGVTIPRSSYFEGNDAIIQEIGAHSRARLPLNDAILGEAVRVEIDERTPAAARWHAVTADVRSRRGLGHDVGFGQR
jgi:hypothetical protein